MAILFHPLNCLAVDSIGSCPASMPSFCRSL